VQVTDLNGETQALPAWAVMDKTGEIPWCPPELIALGVNCGILLSTTPNSGATLTGLPPASPVAVEVLGKIDEEQGFLAFSTEVTTPDEGEAPLQLQVQSEPLMCTLERKNEPTGDGAPGKVDFLGPVKDGLRGDPGVPITRRNEIAIFYDQTGNGNAKLIMRFARRAGRVLDLAAPYNCTNGSCSAGSPSGSAIDAGISVESFFSSDDGEVRVTWSVDFDGLESELRAAEYELSAKDDSPRGDVFGRAFNLHPLPSTCTADQGNDDEWWIGG
ncbi:MAG: hypothetical protein HY702_08620, partial [Gemmatimonadetes bacterium]|nr:hypothetical protein [Gemmatimonadota bacterium]